MAVSCAARRSAILHHALAESSAEMQRNECDTAVPVDGCQRDRVRTTQDRADRQAGALRRLVPVGTVAGDEARRETCRCKEGAEQSVVRTS